MIEECKTYDANIPLTDYLQMQCIGDDVNNSFNDAVINDESNDCRTENTDGEYQVVTRRRRKKAIHKHQQNDQTCNTLGRRPTIVSNNFPENDSRTFGRRMHVPGNSTYASMAQRGKKVLILTDSMGNGLDVKGMNRALVKKTAFKKVYIGATAEDLEHYCLRPLQTEKPDICIVHIGTNNIGKEDDPFSIADKIIRVVKACQTNGCNKVFISSIIYRPDYPDVVIQLNNILRQWQALHNYELIYNDNINDSCIANDNLHLSTKGKNRLSSNFRRALNKLHS